MNYLLCILLAYTLRLSLSESIDCPNNRTIIGILSQEYHGTDQSYIAASYVKFLESAGARVVPILINQNDQYYNDIFNATNGLLMPGGSADLITSGYARAGKKLWDLALKANENGDYYPIWGTCLGFELLTVLGGNNTKWLTKCEASDVAMNLIFEGNPNDSTIFKNADSNIINIFREEDVTANYHMWCLTEQNFTASGLNKIFNIVTTNLDANNLTFISTIEAKNHPIYGVQWHPEKNQFEYVNNKEHLNIPHQYNAILIGQYMANFFVNETRKNNHHFRDILKESNALIYNYEPVYTGTQSSASFEQIYVFSSAKQNEWFALFYLFSLIIILILR